jgi:hypothetical protein
MHIISYVEGIVVDGAHLHLRNPRWYDKPERGFDYVIAKEEHILDDYRQMGVQPYAEVQEEEGQREVELSWNEMRKLAKELSGEVIRSKEQAQEILNRHGY